MFFTSLYIEIDKYFKYWGCKLFPWGKILEDSMLSSILCCCCLNNGIRLWVLRTVLSCEGVNQSGEFWFGRAFWSNIKYYKLSKKNLSQKITTNFESCKNKNIMFTSSLQMQPSLVLFWGLFLIVLFQFVLKTSVSPEMKNGSPFCYLDLYSKIALRIWKQKLLI